MNRLHTVLASTLTSFVTTTSMANLLYSQSFEDPAMLGTEYFDMGNAGVDHWLTNNIGQAAVNGNGFNAWYNSTGGVGLTDGDFVGVTKNSSVTGGMFDGSNAYQMSDTDGIMDLYFDDFGSNVNVTLAIYIADTGYESSDFVSISYGNEVVFDVGNGIDGGLALEALAGSWIYLEAINVSGQLSISSYTNAASESIYIDAINIRSSVPAPGALTLLGVAGVVARRRRK